MSDANNNKQSSISSSTINTPPTEIKTPEDKLTSKPAPSTPKKIGITNTVKKTSITKKLEFDSSETPKKKEKKVPAKQEESEDEDLEESAEEDEGNSDDESSSESGSGSDDDDDGDLMDEDTEPLQNKKKVVKPVSKKSVSKGTDNANGNAKRKEKKKSVSEGTDNAKSSLTLPRLRITLDGKSISRDKGTHPDTLKHYKAAKLMAAGRNDEAKKLYWPEKPARRKTLTSLVNGEASVSKLRDQFNNLSKVALTRAAWTEKFLKSDMLSLIMNYSAGRIDVVSTNDISKILDQSIGDATTSMITDPEILEIIKQRHGGDVNQLSVGQFLYFYLAHALENKHKKYKKTILKAAIKVTEALKKTQEAMEVDKKPNDKKKNSKKRKQSTIDETEKEEGEITDPISTEKHTVSTPSSVKKVKKVETPSNITKTAHGILVKKAGISSKQKAVEDGQKTKITEAKKHDDVDEEGKEEEEDYVELNSEESNHDMDSGDEEDSE